MSGPRAPIKPPVSPGPAAFDALAHDPDRLGGSAAPRFSMSARTGLASGEVSTASRVQTPGPGTYSYDLNKTSEAAPVFTMSGPYSPLKASPSPGPGAYNSTTALDGFASHLDKSPAFTMGARVSPTKTTGQSTPGPGAFDIKSEFGRDAPKITIASRLVVPEHKDHTPGVGAYNLPGSIGVDGPKIKIARTLSPSLDID